MPATLTTRRFTVDEYYRMAEAGILEAGERVEDPDPDCEGNGRGHRESRMPPDLAEGEAEVGQNRVHGESLSEVGQITPPGVRPSGPPVPHVARAGKWRAARRPQEGGPQRKT